MIKKFRKISKVFWAWQDEAEESWLREMGQKGWLLNDYSICVYNFESAEPKDYIYKLDYKATTNAGLDEYLTIFADAGWEHVAEFLGWHYFRAAADQCTLPDIYSDAQSKAEKYQGLLRTVTVLLMSNLAMSASVFFNPIYSRDSGGTFFWFSLVRLAYLFLLALLAYDFVRIRRKIKELKKVI